MNKPLVSIIIPVYNAESSIGKITSSILSEGLKDVELILVDDGSTDSTLKILRGIKSNRKDITVISQKNGGPSSARNSGIKRAKGEYIQFYDADDNIAPGALQTITKEIKKSQPDVLVSGWSIDLESKNETIVGYKKISPAKETVLSKDIIKYTVNSIGTDGKLYNLWNKLFRADIIHNNNLAFREDLRFGEDLVFALEYFKYAEKLIVIPKVTYSYKSSNKTGVFSKSSLVPEYRHANNEALEDFVGQNRNTELDDLFNWVKWRWLLSYWIIVAGSKIQTKEKVELIKEVSKSNYIVAKNPNVIGVKKLILEYTTNILRRIPYVALLISKLMVFVKNTIIKLKSSTKN
jgi:glycosyltransferase involved in cell wall biosynthesis